ncbi:MAG: hypothetical protein AAF810_21285 [Cyanobacteria bacterium P01_D01_bin.36]
MTTRSELLRELFGKYNRQTSKNMSAYNRNGGNVRQPVRASTPSNDTAAYDQAKFNTRKANQIFSQRQPLTRKGGKYDGLPTPAVLQFARWGVPLSTLSDPTYGKIKSIRDRYQSKKEKLAKKLGKPK